MEVETMSKMSADVIIIGGGVNGCATAYYLAKKGVKDVIVLEADKSIGHGGSSRNGGGVRQSGRDMRELPYAMYAVNHMWPTLSEELGVDVEYYQRGNLRMGKTEAHLKKLEELSSKSKALGLNMNVVDAKTVKEICPYLSQEVIGASWCPTDGHANPMITTLAYYKRAIEMGVRFFTDAKVTKLEKYKGKLRKVVMQSGEVFEAEKIIVAAGYESRYLARTVGVDVPLWRYFEEALVTELQPHMFDIMLGCADGDFYGHQTKHGSFVFGSDSGLEDGTDMDLDDMKTSSVTVSAGCRAVMGYIPLLADAKIVRTWGGWIDMCHDGVPVISEVEEVPGMILACGFTGHGFGTAPAVGLMLAQMVLGEKTVVDISALGYDRFKPVR
jgi:sarcosine oxidase subunit beta